MTEEMLRPRQIVEIATNILNAVAENNEQIGATYDYPRFTVTVDYDLDECLTLVFEPKSEYDATFSPVSMLSAIMSILNECDAFADIDPTVEEFTFGYLYSVSDIPYFAFPANQRYADFLVRKFNDNLEGRVSYFGQYRVLENFS